MYTYSGAMKVLYLYVGCPKFDSSESIWQDPKGKINKCFVPKESL